jgi:hypothetical protein
VQAIVDEKVDVEIAPGVVVTVHQGAIGQIVLDKTEEDVDSVDSLPTEPGATGASVADDVREGATYDGEGAAPPDGEPGRRGI